MKQQPTVKLLAASVITLAFAPLIFAQDEGNSDTKVVTQVETDAEDKDSKKLTRYSGVVDAGALVGMSVKNMQDETIGEVDRILADSKSGKIKYAVLGVGGFLGIGETKVAVPWASLSFHNAAEEDGKPDLHVMIDGSREMFENAPKYDEQMDMDIYEMSTLETVDTYWEMDRKKTSLKENRKNKKTSDDDSSEAAVGEVPPSL